MANLTNSTKLILKIEAIDSSISDINDKIGSIPAGTDIGQEISDIKDNIGTVPAGSNVMSEIGAVDDKVDWVSDSIGTVPSGSTVMAEIGAVDDKVDAVSDSIGTVPSGSTVMGEIEAVDNDLQGYKTTVAETYATKSEMASALTYKGSKDTYAELPASGNKVGDVRNIVNADPTHGVKAGDNVAWDGTAWDVLGGVADLSAYFNKNTDTADNIAEGSTHLFLTSAERTILGNTSGTNTGDQSASDFDIKDLTDSTDLRTTWSGKQDAIADLANIRSRAEGSIQATDATFVSNTVSEGTDGSVTVTAADNVTVATAETNNKAAIAALGTAHNNLVDRVEAVEWATGSLPFEAYFAEGTFNNSKVLEISNANIIATSHISYVVKSGSLAGFYLEREVQAGKVTLTSSDNETCTVEVMIINKKSA